MDIFAIQEELYPLIFQNAERLFPEFQFRRTSKGYIASAGPSFDGTSAKAQGKINYLETSPAVLFDNRAGMTRNVIKYIQERERMLSYLDALKFCASFVHFPLDDYLQKQPSPAKSKSKYVSLQESSFTGEYFDIPQKDSNSSNDAGNNPAENNDAEFIKNTEIAIEIEHHKRHALEEIQRLFVEHLWHSTTNQAFTYLVQRGYAEDDIQAMNCGYALPFSHCKQHLRSLGYSDEVIDSLGLQSAVANRINPQRWHKIGETYLVSFPIRDAVGVLQGFIVRADTVEKSEEGKEHYPKYVFTKNLSKAVPVGFNHTLTNTHVIAVEGIVDALFLQARGIKNVIAVGGKYLTDEQIQTLDRYNIRSITLAFDNDNEGRKGTFATIEKLRKFSLRSLSIHSSNSQRRDWNIYVCKQDSMQDTKDPDEFVRTYGIDTFRALVEHDIEEAEVFVARTIAKEVSEEYHVITNKITSPKAHDAVLERSWQYQKLLRSPLHEQTFLNELHHQTGIKPEILQATSEYAMRFFREEEEHQQFRQTLFKAQDLMRLGKPVADVQMLLKRHLESFEKLPSRSEQYSLTTFLEEISAAPDGLRTGFAELDDTVRLSQNGVTIVAARPSHGKTSFKMNLLLNLLELYPDKTFYFFSYEEPVKIITLKLLNILAGIRFEGQQLPNLVQYLRHQYTAAKHFQHETNTNDTSETKNGIFTIEHTSAKQSASIEAVETAKQKLGQYFDTGRLLLFGNRPHPEHIRAMIEQRQIERSVGGVFVDYVQKVKPASGKFATRQLELQNVSSQLHGIAVDLNVPMIVGAQFNREVRTESDVREDCLREAGDLEQDANLVLALWNPAKTEQDETSIQAQLGSKDVRRVELKVKTLKNRDGAVNLKGVPLLYDMPLSTIKSMR